MKCARLQVMLSFHQALVRREPLTCLVTGIPWMPIKINNITDTMSIDLGGCWLGSGTEGYRKREILGWAIDFVTHTPLAFPALQEDCNVLSLVLNCQRHMKVVISGREGERRTTEFPPGESKQIISDQCILSGTIQRWQRGSRPERNEVKQ